MSRDVLVTGGAGFIGSALIRHILKGESRVTVLDNFSFGRKRNLPKNVRVIAGDIRREPSLRRAIDRRYDAVYHLAALHFIPYCNDHPEETISVNITGTQALLRALQRKPPKRLFFPSTAAVYTTTSRYHQESDSPRPMDIYGVTKLTGEHLILNFAELCKVPCAIGRLFNAYGPRETNPHLVPHLVAQLKKGKRTVQLGNLKPYRDYIHTSDMAWAITALTKKASTRPPIANIASGKEYSVREVVEIMSKIIKEPIRIKSRPALRRKSERQHLRADLRTLRRLTQFRPAVRFRNGIHDLLLVEGVITR